jgi:hemerythrin-like metal-binding protein
LYQSEKGVSVDAFTWDSPQIVGVAQLDEQHRSLRQLILGLIRTLEALPADAEAEKTFIRIFENAVLHFRSEEDYLEARGYPDLVPHRFEHELLLDWFRDQMVLRDGPHAAPLVNLVREIGTLIQEHQATVDHAYAVWLETTS